MITSLSWSPLQPLLRLVWWGSVVGPEQPSPVSSYYTWRTSLNSTNTCPDLNALRWPPLSCWPKHRWERKGVILCVSVWACIYVYVCGFHLAGYSSAGLLSYVPLWRTCTNDPWCVCPWGKLSAMACSISHWRVKWRQTVAVGPLVPYLANILQLSCFTCLI